MRLIFLAFLSCLAACRTISPCDFSPSLDGWRPAKSVPAELVQIAGHAGPWYVNDKDQFLACFSSRGKSLCGGNYMIYVKSGNSYDSEDLVICTARHVPPNN